MTAKPTAKPANTTTTKNELKQIIKGILLEMITDGTLTAAMRTYETLTEGTQQPASRQHLMPQHGGFISEQQRAAMNANAVFANDPAMAAVFADTLANAGADQLQEQIRMETVLQRQQQAPVPEFGAPFPRNMLPPRQTNGDMLNENDSSHILPNAPSSNRWAELAFNKSATPKPNRPGFLPGQR